MQAVQFAFKAKELVDISHLQMKEEEGRHNVTVDAFHVAKKNNQELKNKLAESERDRKSAEATLDSAKRQAKGQRVLLCQVEDQLAASKQQIITLKKKLEETKEARDQAKKAKDQAE